MELWVTKNSVPNISQLKVILRQPKFPDISAIKVYLRINERDALLSQYLVIPARVVDFMPR